MENLTASKFHNDFTATDSTSDLLILSMICCLGHTDREKYGLPRLMEALESNMWSTMQRHADGTAVRRSVSNGTASSSNGSSSGSSSSRADLATTATTASEAGPVDSSMSCEPLLSKTADACADGGVSQQQAQQQVPQVDPFSEEMVDSEDNEIIDKFANFISEVSCILSVLNLLICAVRREQHVSLLVPIGSAVPAASSKWRRL